MMRQKKKTWANFFELFSNADKSTFKAQVVFDESEMRFDAGPGHL